MRRGNCISSTMQARCIRWNAAPGRQAAARLSTAQLSETGLFQSVKGHVTEPALVPYSVNSPLWSDNAHKERYIALPGLSQIDFVEEGAWKFPEGAVLVKTFSLDLEVGNPASRKRIETRLLATQQNEWAGYTYIWNDDQTEATLVDTAGADKTFTIRDPRAPQGRKATARFGTTRAGPNA